MQGRLPNADAGLCPPELSTLSPREREVLDPALEGLSARAIARRLSLSEATVRSHLSAIYSKLGVAGRIELLARLNATPSQPLGPEIGTERFQQKPPDSRQGNRRAVALVTVLAVAFVATAFLAIQLGSPRGSDLATASELISSDSVEHVDLSGSMLTITEKGGEQLRIEGVTLDEFQPIQIAAADASIPVTASSRTQSTLATDVAMLGTLMIPVVLLLAVLLAFARLIRRPPSAGLAG